jgi:hypothetical protein
MHPLTCWFVRASLFYSLPGITMDALIPTQKGLSHDPSVWTLFPLHLGFLLIGWFAELAMGVAFSIMPRFNTGSPRRNVSLFSISFVLIKTGLIIGTSQRWFSPAILVGRIFEIGAGIVFVVGSWRRVKPHGDL